MNQTLKDFFERGKSIRHKRQGAFLIVEKDESVLKVLRRWIAEISHQSFLVFSSPCSARDFVKLRSVPIRCAIINLNMFGLCSSEELLKYIDREFPEIVSVAYTTDAGEASRISSSFPRATVVCSGEGIYQLMEALSAEVVGCDVRRVALG